jgi:uncharacterized protein YtpQ (UPF0354 family)
VASWIDALAFRSGPLKIAASHFAAAQGVESDPPRGAHGLSLITRAMREHWQSDLAADERTFVEGSGAYFALVLLDCFGGAFEEHEGEHRLRVGEHGVVDPFASVARALQGDDVRRALLAEVSHAEEEAEGRGPISRVMCEARRQLESSGGFEVVRRFDRKLWVQSDVGTIELDFARIVDVARGESDAVLQAAVGRLCSALVPSEHAGMETWDDARDRILPRLVGTRFVEGLPNHGKDLHLLRLTSEVWVSLVLKYRKRARYVRRDEVDLWSRDGAPVRAQALHNLARASERARFLVHDTERGPLVIAQSRDGLDASRLLLPGLGTLLAHELGSPFVVSVPHRDTLLAVPAGDALLLAELRERTDEAALRAPHAISNTLFLLDETGKIRELGAEGDGSDMRESPVP